MNKNDRGVVVEFANRISEEDLKGLISRLIEQKFGDLADALNFMSKYKDMDNLLSSARNVEEFFELCDHVGQTLAKESRKRGLVSSEAS